MARTTSVLLQAILLFAVARFAVHVNGSVVVYNNKTNETLSNEKKSPLFNSKASSSPPDFQRNVL